MRNPPSAGPVGIGGWRREWRPGRPERPGPRWAWATAPGSAQRQLRCGSRAGHMTSAPAEATRGVFRSAGKPRPDVHDGRGRGRGRPWGRHDAVAPHTVDPVRAYATAGRAKTEVPASVPDRPKRPGEQSPVSHRPAVVHRCPGPVRKHRSGAGRSGGQLLARPAGDRKKKGTASCPTATSLPQRLRSPALASLPTGRTRHRVRRHPELDPHHRRFRRVRRPGRRAHGQPRPGSRGDPRGAHGRHSRTPAGRRTGPGG